MYRWSSIFSQQLVIILTNPWYGSFQFNYVYYNLVIFDNFIYIFD